MKAKTHFITNKHILKHTTHWNTQIHSLKTHTDTHKHKPKPTARRDSSHWNLDIVAPKETKCFFSPTEALFHYYQRHTHTTRTHTNTHTVINDPEVWTESWGATDSSLRSSSRWGLNLLEEHTHTQTHNTRTHTHTQWQNTLTHFPNTLGVFFQTCWVWLCYFHWMETLRGLNDSVCTFVRLCLCVFVCVFTVKVNTFCSFRSDYKKCNSV